MTAGASFATEPPLRNPWARSGLIMAGFWLVFLAYPVGSAARATAPWWARVLTIGCLTAFAATYLLGLSRSWAFGQRRISRTSVTWLAALVGLTLATTPVLGIDAIGTLPFVGAYCCYAFPMRWSVSLSLGTALVSALIPVALGQLAEWGFLAFIVLLTVGANLVMRWGNERGLDYDRAVESLRLAEERERVARDVHDVLGHSLTVVAVKSELAERLLDVDVDRARTELAEIRTLTRTALAEVRETVGGLRVASLADEVDSARMALEGAGIDATLPDDLTVVDPRHRTVLAWILREAVTNVVRHSGARTCRVTLRADGMVVDDDGRGLRGRREGNGLRGLRERLAGVGGTLTLSPGPDGRGTRLEVTL